MGVKWRSDIGAVPILDIAHPQGKGTDIGVAKRVRGVCDTGRLRRIARLEGEVLLNPRWINSSVAEQFVVSGSGHEGGESKTSFRVIIIPHARVVFRKCRKGRP
jgi:hypothetical protein